MNRVVIIDTGIDVSNPKFKYNDNIIDGISIVRDNKDLVIKQYRDDPNNINDEIGHGSAIAGIILSHNPNVELYIVKIFSEEEFFADEEKLVLALEYILNNYNFNIVNLSLGILAIDDGMLKKICDEFRIAQKVIVSAFDNNGAISYPAAFENVFGVTSSDKCIHPSEYYLVNDNVVNICAKGSKQRVYWKNGKQIISSGNSYACAHFSGILSRFKNVNNYEDVINEIQSNSSGVSISGKCLANKLIVNPVGEYKKVIAFPFNKEIHSIVRFSKELSFDLVDVYDIKYSARIGASTNMLLREQLSREYIIKSIECLDWDSFDTIILGHVDELFHAAQLYDQKEKLIKSLLFHGKRIYSFDNIEEYTENVEQNEKELVFSPVINNDYVSKTSFGKLFRQDKPVLGVFGTSSRQGKFTLQLKIRYELLKRGLNICQLGTEPSSLLFGMDIIFPIGYNSSVSLKQDDVIYYLNKQLYDNSRDADIIIVGGQSGVVIRDIGNISHFDYSQLEFIYATLPDASVLCVNSFDSTEQIVKSINFLESVSNNKVIAVVMYPYYFSKNDLLQQHLLPMTKNVFDDYYKKYLEDVLGRPVLYPNNEECISKLCDIIINYFS